LSPVDAAVALRSYPRRFAELVDPHRDPPLDEVARAAVLAEAEGAARTLDAAGAAVQRVLVSDEPELGWSGDPGPAVPAAGDDPLEHLRQAATALADLVARTPAPDWRRTGRRQGQPVRAIELVGEAVHAGAHHLRAAAAAAGAEDAD
jgi:hypothetical protein